MQLSSASFVDGQLSIEVTGNDRVQVSASHGQTVVKFNGHAAHFGTVAASQVAEIVVSADLESAGANRIDLSSVTASRFPHLMGTTIGGGAGNDTIWGSAFNDLIDGGAGNDYLLGRIGDRLDTVCRPGNGLPLQTPIRAPQSRRDSAQEHAQ